MLEGDKMWIRSEIWLCGYDSSQKNPFIDNEASDDDDGEEEEEEEEENSQVEGDDGPSVQSLNVTHLPGPSSAKDRLSAVINHISDRYENAPSTCHRVVLSSGTVPSRMYLLHVHRSAMQHVAEHLRSNGVAVTDDKIMGCLELVASPHANDIQLHLQSRWDVPFFKKTLKTFSLQFLCVSDLARPITGEVCQEIGMVILTNHASGSACLKFIINGHGQELEFRLQDIEHVFWVGDMVRVVVGAYTGLEGHIIKKSEDLFHVCQEATNEEVEVLKYYLDHCPLTHVLQSWPPMQPDFDPLPEPKSLQIRDKIEVCVGEYMGKCRIVVWFPIGGTTLWFQAGGNIKDELINTPTAFVQHICPFKTLQFTNERGYDVKPGDIVTVACGPEFQMKGVVQAMDFSNACLTLISEGDYSLVNIPTGFALKISNMNLDSFCDIIVPSSSSMDPSSSKWSNWSSHNNHDLTDSLSAGVKTYDPWVANNAEDIEDVIADIKEKS
ncbi:uncharacterized protein BJ212DRAFT_1477898 [Suillus subaureus]|uniref:Uncharacterized protein n=1 Tax=Suillus subaureus TaxID=48587 RepID=A0A9P7JH91_9AGAM|nr:uncharacterized protein BJ212DRAFT_1477898 [Suillus subaureus]KAG1822069.1 hypothetical protein BJ212DRAFT_1477898 [Suillus subaureus]